MLTLARTYTIVDDSVSAKPASEANEQDATFLGIVQPLFFVAVKCRDPGLRREALSLLQWTCNHKEGQWGGKEALAAAEVIVRIEEGDRGPSSAADVPANTRIGRFEADQSGQTANGNLNRSLPPEALKGLAAYGLRADRKEMVRNIKAMSLLHSGREV
jgi:hypothetical protein